MAKFHNSCSSDVKPTPAFNVGPILVEIVVHDAPFAEEVK